MTGSAEHFQYLARRRRTRILLSGVIGTAIVLFVWYSNRNARQRWLRTAPVEAVLESAERAGNDQELVYAAAFRAYKDGRNNEAYRLMTGLVKQHPRNAAYWSGLGRTASAAGNAEEAVIAYRRAVELDPKLPYPHYYMGHIYASAGLSTDAIREYEEAIRREGKLSDNPEPYARSLCAKGRYQEAWDLLTKYYDLIRVHDSAYVLMGKCAQVLGKYEEAREKMIARLGFTRAYPVPTVRIALGRLILHNSKDPVALDEALTLAKSAIREPIPEAFAFLAEVRALRGDLKGATLALDAGLKRDSDNPECLSAQAILYDAKGLPAKAAAIRRSLSSGIPEVAALKRATSENPRDAKAGLALAEALMKRNEPGPAGEACLEVLHHSPGNVDAQRLLDRARTAAFAGLSISAPKAPRVGFAGS